MKEWIAQPLRNRLLDNQTSPNNLPPQVLEVRRVANRLTWLGNALHVLSKGKCLGEYGDGKSSGQACTFVIPDAKQLFDCLTGTRNFMQRSLLAGNMQKHMPSYMPGWLINFDL